jgi:nicotinamidase-related amidase
MKHARTAPALVIIDVQQAIDDPVWGRRNNPHAEMNMAQMLRRWRAANWPVVHIRHDSVQEGSPYAPGTSGHAFKPETTPQAGERVFGKTTNNAFVGTGLEAYLQGEGITRLVITGVLTQHSVDTSARMAASLGFEVTLVADATAATETLDRNGRLWPAEEVHALTLAHFQADYGCIRGTEEILQAIEDYA